MIRKQGKPITGNPQMVRVRKPVPTNQNNTSAQAQQMIRRGPAALTNKGNAATAPAPRNPNYAVQGDFSKQGRAYGAGRLNSVHEKHTVPYGNVGYPQGPYSSNRGRTPSNSGYPQGSPREVGSGSQPKARVGGKMKTNLDIFNARTLHEAGLTKL